MKERIILKKMGTYNLLGVTLDTYGEDHLFKLMDVMKFLGYDKSNNTYTNSSYLTTKINKENKFKYYVITENTDNGFISTNKVVFVNELGLLTILLNLQRDQTIEFKNEVIELLTKHSVIKTV